MHAIFKVLDVSNRTQAVIKYSAINRVSPTAMTQAINRQFSEYYVQCPDEHWSSYTTGSK